MPEREPTAYTVNNSLDVGTFGGFPNLIEVGGKPVCLQQNSDGEYFHCYTIMRLDAGGANLTAEYYQVDSANNGQESLLYSETI